MSRETAQDSSRDPLLIAVLVVLVVLIVVLLIGWLDMRGMVTNFLRSSTTNPASARTNSATVGGAAGTAGAAGRAGTSGAAGISGNAGSPQGTNGTDINVNVPVPPEQSLPSPDTSQVQNIITSVRNGLGL